MIPIVVQFFTFLKLAAFLSMTPGSILIQDAVDVDVYVDDGDGDHEEDGTISW